MQIGDITIEITTMKTNNAMYTIKVNIKYNIPSNPSIMLSIIRILHKRFLHITDDNGYYRLHHVSYKH